MHESALLQRIFDRTADLAGSFGDIHVGPGDDCAVVGREGATYLLTVDQLIEHRHFHGPPETPLELIARKAIARSISDIAAMGGTPVVSLATGALPSGCDYADQLFDHMHRWAARLDCPLVGGDIAIHSRTPPGPLSLTVTAVGAPHPARGPVLRSGAKPGDGLYVSGSLGGSFESGRHLEFEPRIRTGAGLCAHLGDRLHAMIDLSDGLGRDAGRMAAASRVRIEIEADLIPRHDGVEGWEQALGEGEDYELCFAAAGDVPEVCAATGIRLTRIGTVMEGEGCHVLTDEGEADVSDIGWDHS